MYMYVDGTGPSQPVVGLLESCRLSDFCLLAAAAKDGIGDTVHQGMAEADASPCSHHTSESRCHSSLLLLGEADAPWCVTHPSSIHASGSGLR